jgi:DNA (cytosine-5)-methyltransferase 1
MVLRVGTDCSGIEAPLQALKNLKVPFKQMWSCEIDKYARKSCEANYPVPKHIFTDITTRNHSDLPDIDLYVCGFPCQSFSLAGKKMGMEDPRGLIMNHCISVIEFKQPTYFILENVKNFKHIDQGKAFKYLLDKIEDMGTYNVYHDIYNTKDYGIPQNRERIYIIGILKSKQKSSFVKPLVKKCKPIKDFILDTTVQNREHPNYIKSRVERVSDRINTAKYIHIISSSKNGFLLSDLNIIPALTLGSNHYILNYNRLISAKEALMVQGFPKSFNQVVSNTQLKKQAGNAMSVCVVHAILKELFKCM